MYRLMPFIHTYLLFLPKIWNMDSINKSLIEKAWDDRSLLSEIEVQNEIIKTIDLLDKGQIRVAEPGEDGWILNQWIKKAVILYFPIRKMETFEVGPFEFNDKIPLKKNYRSLGIRVVPHAIARYGSYLAPGVIMMPSYVNIGAHVGEGTMIDTWATVGSCAQIGKNVHLSGGVGVGGVLEPVQASPVIIEDNCFIGSRCIIVEGAHIGKEAVLGASVVITNSTKIIDVTSAEKVEYKGYVPPRSVVIPGSYLKKYPAGDFSVNCALIIGTRKESTDKKTTLNEALREYDIPA
jgi:2,3,4,5-tetrahydropyridine-2,6-dicarboxylate N-succinyltransferase